MSEKIVKELEKKYNSLNLGFAALRERVLMLENKIDKIQAKKEVNYVELVKALLDHINTRREQQHMDYIEVIKQLMKER